MSFKNIATGVLLVIVGFVLAIAALFSSSDSRDLPQNFESAPISIACGSEEPLAIHAKFYLNQKEHWNIIILGRNYTDLYTALIKEADGKKNFREWARLPNGEWVDISSMGKDEREYHTGAAKLFTIEEKVAFLGCLKKALSVGRI